MINMRFKKVNVFMWKEKEKKGKIKIIWLQNGGWYVLKIVFLVCQYLHIGDQGNIDCLIARNSVIQLFRWFSSNIIDYSFHRYVGVYPWKGSY